MTDCIAQLDATGLNCPLPILKTKKALAGLASGQALHVTATDPGSVRDFQTFCKQTGHDLTSAYEEGETFHFFITKR